MFKTFSRMICKKQQGITGIETAIILIAFVIVAAVFAYVAISSGLFATQKSQEAIYKGLETAEGSIVLKGGLVAIAETSGAAGYVSQFSFTLTPAMRGNPIDFTPPVASATNTGFCDNSSQNVVVISYMDSHVKVDNLFWTLTKCGYSDDDNLLDENEMFQITVGAPVAGAGGGNLVNALGSNHLGINSTFSLQITTGGTGSTLVMERTTPAFIDPVINLH